MFPETAFGFVCQPSAWLSAWQEVPVSRTAHDLSGENRRTLVINALAASYSNARIALSPRLDIRPE